jgi:glutamyl-Q tRNA(Asp) synthetase
MTSSYIGRFAPSPTGPLHAGSLVAALASWLDAKAHDGQWLVRIEDVDTPRCVPGTDHIILQQLAVCGLHPDAPPIYQSQRGHLYQQALNQLVAQAQAYPCSCSRLDIEQAIAAAGQQRARHAELVYPGTCRGGLNGKQARSWRFLSTFQPSNGPSGQQIPGRSDPEWIAHEIHWVDRRLGQQHQNVSRSVGDFVLQRADGLWAYQLAVVVDDAAQGITHIVRGADLADNTARQILLQRALGLPQAQYLHTPVVLGVDGDKLSKQNGAQALDLQYPLEALAQAGQHLGITCFASNPADWLQQAVGQWMVRLVARSGALKSHCD